jgi:hypothetical protein
MVGRFCCKDLLSFQKRLGRHSAWQEHIRGVRDHQGAFQAMDILNSYAKNMQTFCAPPLQPEANMQKIVVRAALPSTGRDDPGRKFESLILPLYNM